MSGLSKRGKKRERRRREQERQQLAGRVQPGARWDAETPVPVALPRAYVKGPLGEHEQRIVSAPGVVPVVVAVDGFGYYAVGPNPTGSTAPAGLVALHTESEWSDPELRPVRTIEDGTIVVVILGSAEDPDLELYIGRPE